MDGVREKAIESAMEAVDIKVKWFADRETCDPPKKAVFTKIITAYEAALWQPIETAPKDGKIVMAWSPERKMEFQVCWDRNGDRDGWCFAAWGAHFVPFELTHWQPLAGPPKP